MLSRNESVFRRLSVQLITIASLFSILFAALTISILTKIYRSDVIISASADEEKSIIILDAGHGGEDCGAIGASGVYEKDLNFDITMHIGKLLEGYGYKVVYTRTEDKLLYKPEEDIKGIRKISDLKNRCKIAQEYENAIFISIHMNSFSDSRYSGLQVYYSGRNERSSPLAQAIQASVKTNLQTNNKRKIKASEGMYLLNNLDMPAILIECGFLSNLEECKKLSEKEYQKELSFSIVCGIIEYMDKISD